MLPAGGTQILAHLVYGHLRQTNNKAEVYMDIQIDRFTTKRRVHSLKQKQREKKQEHKKKTETQTDIH